MDRGYLKLWRRSLESEVFACPNLWRLWSWCLMKTTYKKRIVSLRVGKGIITIRLEPGQFVFGRNAAAEELLDKPSTIWKRMKKLEFLECIAVNSNNQYSIISICNWADYQIEEEEKEQVSNSQVTSKEQVRDTNKKGNKNKKDKTILTLSQQNDFNNFYQHYPKKQGKANAQKAWLKLNPSSELLGNILTSLSVQCKTEAWTKDNGKYIPQPATWLNGKRWEDEFEVEYDEWGP